MVFLFLSDHWRKGYATETGKVSLEFGFKQLKLQRIIAMVLPANKNFIHVLEKLGFEFEKEIIEEGEPALLYTVEKKLFSLSQITTETQQLKYYQSLHDKNTLQLLI